MSQHAPRIVVVKIHPDKIRDIIGPGGKTIRGIVDQTGCSIDVEDDGTVNVASPDGDALGRALEIIEGLTAMPELGKIYVGRVVKIAEFGAFCQILPGTDGLLHISEIADFRIPRVEDILTEGDEVTVKVIGIDGQSGKIKLSRREAMADLAKMAEEAGGTNGATEAPADKAGDDAPEADL
jgi:polyribonucleotide nucleotidyltransferase